jgi:hypothetical protein
MGEYSEAFVGIDVAKGRNAIAIADGERGGEVRYLGEVDASPTSMTRIVRRLAEKVQSRADLLRGGTNRLRALSADHRARP